MLPLLFACLSVLGHIYCLNIAAENRAIPQFLPGSSLGHVTRPDETSGLCASRVHPNILYTHNNMGDGPKLYAISSLTGEPRKVIHLYGAHNHDWEDIACGPCDDLGGHCIYVGDIGDHSGDGARNIIYKVREPAVMDFLDGDITVDVEQQLRFIWNPPQKDSETLMVDPLGNLYIITKTHHQIFYWQRTEGSSGKDTLLQSPTSVPFHDTKHVDSVAWDVLGRGYYTVSEGQHDNLYYYARQ